MGGNLAPLGGRSLIEPCGLRLPVLFGNLAATGECRLPTGASDGMRRASLAGVSSRLCIPKRRWMNPRKKYSR